MRNHHVPSAVVVFLLVVAASARAQVDVSILSVRAGVIRTLNPDHSSASESRWSLYPEVEMGGMFFTPSVSWGISWGYWYDGGGDYTNYADRSHIISMRLSFLPQVLAPHWLIPLKLSGGIAEHFIHRENVGRTQWAETVCFPVPWRQEGAFQSTTLYAGVGLSLSLSTSLRLEAEAAEHFPVSNQPPIDYEQKNRWVFTLGIAYSL